MRANIVNASQMLILQALTKCHPNGLTRQEIEKRTGASATPFNLGPVDIDGNLMHREEYKLSLRTLGYLRVQLEEEADGMVPRYYATTKGRKLTEKFISKAPIKVKDKIPYDLIDPIVLKMKPTRVYGIDNYTESDLKEIRDALGEGYEKLPLNDIYRQIVNRRKLGVYSDPQNKVKILAKKVLAAIGDEGTLIKGLLTPDQVKAITKVMVSSDNPLFD